MNRGNRHAHSRAKLNTAQHRREITLVAEHDGDVALLVSGFDLNGGLIADRAARELCRTEAEIKNAHEKLAEWAFAPGRKARAKEDKSSSSRGASGIHLGGYRAPLEGQRISGRYRSGAAQARQSPFNGRAENAFGIYDYLALPADVIFMLIGYCIDVFTEKIRSRPALDAQHRKGSHGQTRRSSIEQAIEYIGVAAESARAQATKTQWRLTAALSRRPSAVTTLSGSIWD